MFVFFQILIGLCPIFPLGYLAYRAYKFDEALKEKRMIREAEIQFKGIRDVSPKRLGEILKSIGVVKRFIDDFLKNYKELLFALCVYLTFWVLYIICIVVRIYWVFNNHYEGRRPEEFGGVIGSILMSILITYWFLLTPIFEIFHLQRLSNWGYITWEFIQKASGKIVEYCVLIFKHISQVLLSLLLLYVYVKIADRIAVCIGVEISF